MSLLSARRPSYLSCLLSARNRSIWNRLAETALDDAHAYADRNGWTVAKNVHPAEVAYPEAKSFSTRGDKPEMGTSQ